MDSAEFFHPEGERGPARTDRINHANQVCRSCPVLHQCRRHALALQEPYGVWAGLSESDRGTMLQGRDDVVYTLEASRRAVPVALTGNLRLV